MQTLKSKQSGFSLVELMIAICVFLFGLLAIANLQIRAISYSAGANTRTVATSVANSILEEILSHKDIGDDDYNFSTDDGGDWLFGGTSTTLSLDGGGTYTATWSVETDTPIEDIAKVSVTVSGLSGNPVTVTTFKRFIAVGP